MGDYITGSWYSFGSWADFGAHGNYQVPHPGVATAMRVKIDGPTALSGLRIFANLGAVPGETRRFGIYASSNTTGFPVGAPIVDSGLLAVIGSGTNEFLFTPKPIGAGSHDYWLVCLCGPGSTGMRAAPNSINLRYASWNQGVRSNNPIHAGAGYYRTQAGMSLVSYSGAEFWSQILEGGSIAQWNLLPLSASAPLAHRVFWQTRPPPEGGWIRGSRQMVGGNWF